MIKLGPKHEHIIRMNSDFQERDKYIFPNFIGKQSKEILSRSIFAE